MAKDRFPRTPYDGKPYYCKTCGMGFNEWLACEAPDCELEPEAEAQARAAEHQRRAGQMMPVSEALRIDEDAAP